MFGGGSSFGAQPSAYGGAGGSAFGGGGGAFGAGGGSAFGAPAGGGGMFGAAPQGGYGASSFGGGVGGFGAGGMGGGSAFGAPAGGGGLFGGAPGAGSSFGAGPGGGGLFGGGGGAAPGAFGTPAGGGGYGAAGGGAFGGGAGYGQPQSGFASQGAAFGTPGQSAFGGQSGYGGSAYGAGGTAAGGGGMFGGAAGGGGAAPAFAPQQFLQRFEDDQYLSINAKPENRTLSVEELRLRDYQQGQRGPGGGAAGGGGMGMMTPGAGGGMFGATQPGSAFGAAPGSAGGGAFGMGGGGGGGLFGSPAGAGAGGGLFGGGGGAGAGSSLFGGGGGGMNAGRSMGGGGAFNSPAQGGGVFGGAGGGGGGAGLFAGPSGAGSGLFGGGGTGGGGLFGGGQPQQSSMFGGAGGQSSSLFGPGQSGGGAGLFGNQPGSASRGLFDQGGGGMGGGSSSLFGGGGGGGGLFGGATSANTFGSPSAGGGLFGNNSQGGLGAGSAGGGLFGGGQGGGMSAAGGLFGNAGGGGLFANQGGGGNQMMMGMSTQTPQEPLPPSQPYNSDAMLKSAEMVQRAWQQPTTDQQQQQSALSQQQQQGEKKEGGGVFPSPVLIATPLRMDENRTLSIAPRSATFLLHSGRKTPLKPAPSSAGSVAMSAPASSARSRASGRFSGATPGSTSGTPIHLPSIRAKTPLGRDLFAQIALGSAVRTPSKEESEEASPKKTRNPHAPVIVDVKKGYSTQPSIDELASKSDEELSRVEEFSIERDDVGKIVWLSRVNVRDLRIGEDVQILSGRNDEDDVGIVVHPDGQVPRGERLNMPARCQVYIPDDLPNATNEQEERAVLLQLCDADNLIFVNWETETRSFTYEVECFHDFEKIENLGVFGGEAAGGQIMDEQKELSESEEEYVMVDGHPIIDESVRTYKYSTTPSLDVLSTMSSKELKKVRNFSVERADLGKVEWLEPVDVRGLVIGKDITIEELVVELYQGQTMPNAGNKLNKPARCTLTALDILSEKDARDYCAVLKVKFIEWNSEMKQLVFEVDDWTR